MSQLAPFRRRLAGGLIDFFIICLLFVVSANLMLTTETGFGITLLYVALAMDWLGSLAFCGGQTPGRFLLGLRVVKIDGTPATIGSALLRYTVKWVFVFAFMISVLSVLHSQQTSSTEIHVTLIAIAIFSTMLVVNAAVLFRPGRPLLHDLVSKTRVVTVVSSSASS